jgi:REP-associated tyrosine transposase
MPDHVHFFARPEAGARPMAKWIQMWKGVSARKIAKALNLAPPIWQADYFDRYLRSTESYSQEWDYVEQNPVRADLVEHVSEWPHRGIIHDLML